MKPDRLIEFLRSVDHFNPAIEAYIRDTVYEVHYTKGQIMASPGKRADEIWFILNGMAKEYYYDSSGKNIITTFWKENELMFIAESFFLKIPSDRYIELIEDSTVLTLSGKQVLKLQLEHPDIHILGYSILSGAKRKSDERGALLMLSGKDRHKEFCKHFPSTRISVADAASYLGLTRETVSMLRGKR